MPEDMFHQGTLHLCLALLCAALIAFSKTGIAGAGSLAIPLMATIFPAGPSTGILLPILVVGDLFAIGFYRRHAVWKHVLRCLPWAVAGILAGWAFLFLWYRPLRQPLRHPAGSRTSASSGSSVASCWR